MPILPKLEVLDYENKSLLKRGVYLLINATFKGELYILRVNYFVSAEVDVSLRLTHIVLVMRQKLRSNPHVSKLGHQKTKTVR